ncbi:PH domain-containing protein [Rhizobium sp. CCGE 510]|uniref:PH domain-containing protein n=1 Tax=Rhizobium sp. CCGE 510 TaxID=1132836 RepID=UPI0005653946|nr:PH domain-containing protein [Rhizobium sp. CCGE 510]
MFRAIWDVESEIRNELHPAEVVVWIGQPTAWGTFVFKWPDVFFGVIFAILGSTLLLPADNGVVSIDKPAGIMGIIFPGIFALIGIATIAGVVFDMIATSRTAYAVTDRRLLIIRNMIRRRVTTIAPTAINVVEVREKWDRSGTLTYRREGDGDSVKKFGFFGIPDVREVAKHVEELRMIGKQASQTN